MNALMQPLQVPIHFIFGRKLVIDPITTFLFPESHHNVLCCTAFYQLSRMWPAETFYSHSQALLTRTYFEHLHAVQLTCFRLAM